MFNFLHVAPIPRVAFSATYSDPSGRCFSSRWTPRDPFHPLPASCPPVHCRPVGLLSAASTSFPSWNAACLSPRPLWGASLLLLRASLTGPSSLHASLLLSQAPFPISPRILLHGGEGTEAASPGSRCLPSLGSRCLPSLGSRCLPSPGSRCLPSPGSRRLPSLAQHSGSRPSLSCLFIALLLCNFVSQTWGCPHSFRPLRTLLQIEFTLLPLCLTICRPPDSGCLTPKLGSPASTQYNHTAPGVPPVLPMGDNWDFRGTSSSSSPLVSLGHLVESYLLFHQMLLTSPL